MVKKVVCVYLGEKRKYRIFVTDVFKIFLDRGQSLALFFIFLLVVKFNYFANIKSFLKSRCKRLYIFSIFPGLSCTYYEFRRTLYNTWILRRIKYFNIPACQNSYNQKSLKYNTEIFSLFFKFIFIKKDCCN